MTSPFLLGFISHIFFTLQKHCIYIDFSKSNNTMTSKTRRHEKNNVIMFNPMRLSSRNISALDRIRSTLSNYYSPLFQRVVLQK